MVESTGGKDEANPMFWWANWAGKLGSYYRELTLHEIKVLEINVT